MVVWSSILRSTSRKLNGLDVLLFKQSPLNSQIRCMSGHRVMNIKSSSWEWHKTKDMLHFYFMIGLIPTTIITFFVYVFVGPATLEPIPEGYEPKFWEYYRNPMTRFMARYISTTPQEIYEKYLHVMYQEDQIMKTRQLQQRVEDLIKERHDYKFFYYRRGPVEKLNRYFVEKGYDLDLHEKKPYSQIKSILVKEEEK